MKSVIYTCLYGSGENINEQEYASDREVDMVCFTDQRKLESSTWRVVYDEGSGIGSKREAKKPKIQPHLYLGDYDVSLYVDNTVKLKKKPSEIISNLKTLHSEFALIRHPWRDCIYDEAEEVIALGFEEEKRVREQMDCYRGEGYAAHSGLIAGTFIFRNHHSRRVKKVCEDWWEHVLRYGARDQLSFNYVAWRNGYLHTVLNIDLCDNEYFCWPITAKRIPRDFCARDYLWLNPDLRGKIDDAETHFVEYGMREGRVYKYGYTNQLTRLANKYRSDKGSLYYNKHHYTRVYGDALSHLQCESFSLLEIGLLRHDIQAALNSREYDDAPSLKMWAEFFPNADVLGFDIQNFASVENERIRFCQGDQYSTQDLVKPIARIRTGKPLEVIIDDGSHGWHHQQRSLSFLFRFLEPGGYYFIENLHYQPAHLERADTPKTSEFLRRMMEGVVEDNPHIPRWDMQMLRDSIASITFYDSCDPSSSISTRDALAVIQKKAS